MRSYFGLIAAIALALCGGAAARGQSTTNSGERMDQFERRLSELEKKHEADLKERDEEIARLKAQLQAPTTAPAAGRGEAGRPDEIEQTKRNVLKDIETREAVPLTLRTPANFNPDLAVIGDFKGSISTNGDNPARNRFDLGTLEFELRAAVDPRADAVAVIPFTRDVDDPLFFDKAAASGDV